MSYKESLHKYQAFAKGYVRQVKVKVEMRLPEDEKPEKELEFILDVPVIDKNYKRGFQHKYILKHMERIIMEYLRKGYEVKDRFKYYNTLKNKKVLRRTNGIPAKEGRKATGSPAQNRKRAA